METSIIDEILIEIVNTVCSSAKSYFQAKQIKLPHEEEYIDFIYSDLPRLYFNSDGFKKTIINNYGEDVEQEIHSQLFDDNDAYALPTEMIEDWILEIYFHDYPMAKQALENDWQEE